MTVNDEYKTYFEDNSAEWLRGAYDESDYVYPVGKHRLRILKRIISKYDLNSKKCLDIGCGGGDISLFIASQGAEVVGIDMSEAMLSVANERKDKLPESIKEKVSFRYENIVDLSKDIQNNTFDFIIAFGLIGYLESDLQFFEVIKGLCKKDTILVVSCRNELFNMTSISANTINEIKKGNAINLIEEIDGYYSEEIPEKKCELFIENLKTVLKQIDRIDVWEGEKQKQEGCYNKLQNPPRQSTPQSLKLLAEKMGFELCQYYGVHPHLLLPRFNKKLPPRVFNLLSDTLCVFEEEDISLIWSSVFVGEYRMK